MVGPFLKKKDRLGADAWGSTDKDIRQVIAPLEDLFKKEFPEYNPYPTGINRHITLLIRNLLISEALLPEYCNLFKGKTDEEIIALARSFNFENYTKRERLEKILTGKEK